jgi:hypothetical protein
VLDGHTTGRFTEEGTAEDIKSTEEEAMVTDGTSKNTVTAPELTSELLSPDLVEDGELVGPLTGDTSERTKIDITGDTWLKSSEDTELEDIL